MSFRVNNNILTGHFNYPQEKNELNLLWLSFMTTFNYSSFYDLDSKKSSEKLKDFNIPNTIVKNIEKKKLLEFFQKNSISISENGCLNDPFNSNNYFLSEAKIWIMYIIYNLQDPLCSTEKILKLFSFALKYNADSISLFEFFLIYISQLPIYVYENDIQNTYSNLIPEEFVLIYNEKKNILYKIFNQKEENEFNIDNEISDDEENNINDFSFSKSIQDNSIFQDELISEIKCPNSILKNEIDNYLISDDIKKEKKEEILINDYKVISPDFENKGLIALLMKNETLNNVIFIPLKEQFGDFSEKLEVRELINHINKMYYNKEVEYIPYNHEIVNRIKL